MFRRNKADDRNGDSQSLHYQIANLTNVGEGVLDLHIRKTKYMTQHLIKMQADKCASRQMQDREKESR